MADVGGGDAEGRPASLRSLNAVALCARLRSESQPAGPRSPGLAGGHGAVRTGELPRRCDAGHIPDARPPAGLRLATVSKLLGTRTAGRYRRAAAATAT